MQTLGGPSGLTASGPALCIVPRSDTMRAPLEMMEAMPGSKGEGMAGVVWRLRKCLAPRWRQRLKREILLCRPSLYALDSIRYEQSLPPDELSALLARLDTALDVPGDVIECGCFLCGTTVQMARHLQMRKSDKKIYACDSFEGFDPAEISREKTLDDASDCQDYTDNDFGYIQRKLKRLRVADGVVLVRGFFQDTLESLRGPFCLAFIDCDLHDSMLYAARAVWPRLAPGGYCVFDDYDNDHFRGATKAIDTFIAEQADSIRDHGQLLGKLYFARK